MEIEIKCTYTELVHFNDLHALQGGLKIREDRDIDQIKNSIIEHGFLFPLFIWQSPENRKHIIAGHGRLQAVAELRQEGFTFDYLPIDYIHADSLENAKHILLHEISTYGKLTVDTILEFSSEMVVDFSEMSFPSGELQFRKGGFLQEKEENDNPEIEENPIPTQIKCVCSHCQKENLYNKKDIEYLLRYKRYNKYSLNISGVTEIITED